MVLRLPCFDDFASRDEEHLREVAWGRCFSFYAVLAMLAVLAQWTVQSNNFRCHQMPVYDFIATFVIYGCAICHSYIDHLYGPMASLSTYLLVNFGFLYILVGSANPLPKVMSLMACCDKLERDMLSWRIGANVVGGLVSHPFSKVLWKQLNQDVNPRLLERLHCGAPINIPLGVGTEFVGTMVVCALFSSALCCAYFDAYQVGVKVLVDCLIQSLGVHEGSVHLNPALAGSQSFGCGRHSDIVQGLVIHGIAPLAAAMVFVQYNCCQFCGPCNEPACGSTGPGLGPCCGGSCGASNQATPCAPCIGGGGGVVPRTERTCCTTAPYCNDKITAQVKQSKGEDGRRKVDYCIFFPPMCTEKGIRLRHKFVIDKDDDDDDNDDDKGEDNEKSDKDAGKKDSKGKDKSNRETSDEISKNNSHSGKSSAGKASIKHHDKAKTGHDSSAHSSSSGKSVSASKGKTTSKGKSSDNPARKENDNNSGRKSTSGCISAGKNDSNKSCHVTYLDLEQCCDECC